jgi:hypothetical protein
MRKKSAEFLVNKIRHLKNNAVHCTAVSTNTIILKATLSVHYVH